MIAQLIVVSKRLVASGIRRIQRRRGKLCQAWEDEPREKEGDVCTLATGTTLATSTVSPLALLLLPRATFVQDLDNETR